jgi:hypothetical protein
MKSKVFTKRKIEFLKHFLNIQLTKQNEYIKINDAKEIEQNNIVIMKVLNDIKTLENNLQNNNRVQYIARLENDF